MNQMTFGVLHMTPKKFQQRLGISDDEMRALTQKFMVAPQAIAALERKVAAHQDCAMAYREEYEKLLGIAMDIVNVIRDQYGLLAKHKLEVYCGTDPVVIAAQVLARLLK